MKDPENDNLVYFPGIVEKLIEKGMAALKEKRHTDALNHFVQSSSIEPENPQARYGVVISNIELNRLEIAREHCESMLKEGIGDYYEVLQVYVSLLVQLGDYKEVVLLLESVTLEEKLPAEMAESFYQLLSFARNFDEENDNDIHRNNREEKKVLTSDEFTYLTEQLFKDNQTEKQWAAIRKLIREPKERIITQVEKFFKDPSRSPLVKSYLLQSLHKLGWEDTVTLSKFSKIIEVKISEVEDIFHEQYGLNVIKIIEQQVGDKNPSLHEMIKQMLWHHLYLIYPFKPEPADIHSSACSFHLAALKLLEDKIDAEEVCKSYGITTSSVHTFAEEIVALNHEYSPSYHEET